MCLFNTDTLTLFSLKEKNKEKICKQNALMGNGHGSDNLKALFSFQVHSQIYIRPPCKC